MNELVKNKRQWFMDRIGKRVYRTQSTCECEICTTIYHEGLIICDAQHAQYLFDIQNETDLRYFDNPNKNSTI